MRYLDSVARAGRSLKNAKARTILTALAIAVGAFTLTLAIAAGTGARDYADKLIQSNVDPQSIFVARDGSLFGGDGPPGAGGLKEYNTDTTEFGGASFKSLTAENIAMIEQVDGVESVTPTYILTAEYVTFEGDDTKYTSDITAYDPSVRAETAAGTIPDLGKQIGPKEIIVPESYADKIGKTPAELVGSAVNIHLQKTTNQPSEDEIAQAFATGGSEAVQQLFDIESKDVEFTIVAVSAQSSTSFTASTGLFISESAARELSDYVTEGTDQYRKYLTATVQVEDGTEPQTVKDAIINESKEGGEELIVRTAEDLQDLLFTIVNIIQSIVIVFGVLALIASVFGIINTQYISVLERTREIGLMKALGMRGRHVRRLFQLEAAWIGLLGGAIGAVVAWIVGVAINPWLSEFMGIGENRILIFEVLPIFGLIVLLITIAMVAGWFPARKAAKLDPIEALRTE